MTKFKFSIWLPHLIRSATQGYVSETPRGVLARIRLNVTLFKLWHFSGKTQLIPRAGPDIHWSVPVLNISGRLAFTDNVREQEKPKPEKRSIMR